MNKTVGEKLHDADEELAQYRDIYITPLANQYLRIQSDISHCNAQLKALKDELEMIKTEISLALDNQKIESIKTPKLNFKYVDEYYPNVTDQETYFKWVIDTKNYNITPAKIIKKTEFDALIEKGELPPGVEVKKSRMLKIVKNRSK